MKGGTIKRGYLGVGIQPMNEDIAAAMGLPKDQGEIIGRVEPGGPGARAGFRPGDVVLRVGGKPVTPDQTLSRLVADTPPGTTTRFDVVRDGRPLQLSAAVGTRPSDDQLAALSGGGDDDGLPDENSGTPGTAQGANAIGVQVVPLTPGIARSVGVDSTVQGVVIAQVDPASDAATKGLKRGDVVTSVNATPVRTGTDMARAVAAAKAAGRPQVLLNVTRGKQGGGYIPVRIK